MEQGSNVTFAWKCLLFVSHWSESETGLVIVCLHQSVGSECDWAQSSYTLSHLGTLTDLISIQNNQKSLEIVLNFLKFYQFWAKTDWGDIETH